MLLKEQEGKQRAADTLRKTDEDRFAELREELNRSRREAEELREQQNRDRLEMDALREQCSRGQRETDGQHDRCRRDLGEVIGRLVKLEGAEKRKQEELVDERRTKTRRLVEYFSPGNV